MLSVEAASSIIMQHFDKLSEVAVPILDTLGYTLAEDIYSSINIPPNANSGMDGYAIIANNLSEYNESNPITLTVIGTVPAGSVPQVEVSDGTAVRIMTGASIPNGATAVVPFEETDEIERITNKTPLNEITIKTKLPAGSNIRAAAEDVKVGDLILESGITIRQQEIAVLASLGLAQTTIIRKPVVGVISTGDELIELGEQLVNRAYTPEVDDPATIQIENAEQTLYDLATTGEIEGGFQDFKSTVISAIGMAEIAHKRDGQLSGVSTGLRDLDQIMGGLHPSDLVILAARPSMGKTALATNIAFNAAYDHKYEIDESGERKDVMGVILIIRLYFIIS